MKQTVEAAAREYSNDQRNRQHHCEPYCIVDFKSGVDWLSKQSPWISVEERLPEYSCWVLVAGKDYKYRILFYCGGKFYTNKSLIAYDGSVLFWMFIPSFDQILEANKDVLQRLK